MELVQNRVSFWSSSYQYNAKGSLFWSSASCQNAPELEQKYLQSFMLVLESLLKFEVTQNSMSPQLCCCKTRLKINGLFVTFSRLVKLEDRSVNVAHGEVHRGVPWGELHSHIQYL